MIVSALGFGGSIGRLRYFLLSTALAIVMAALTSILFFSLAPRYTAEVRATGEVPGGLVLSIAVVVLPIFLWASAALATQRLRDIGWKPLYVIPAWVLAIVLDTAVAVSVHSLAIEEGNQTAFGVVINLIMVGVLLFWPGRDSDEQVIRSGPPPRPTNIGVPPPADPPRTLRPTFATPSGPRVFGRRRT